MSILSTRTKEKLEKKNWEKYDSPSTLSWNLGEYPSLQDYIWDRHGDEDVVASSCYQGSNSFSSGTICRTLLWGTLNNGGLLRSRLRVWCLLRTGWVRGCAATTIPSSVATVNSAIFLELSAVCSFGLSPSFGMNMDKKSNVSATSNIIWSLMTCTLSWNILHNYKHITSKFCTVYTTNKFHRY